MKNNEKFFKWLEEKKVVINGNELIILKEFCNEFLIFSRHEGYAVIGIEGFNFLDGGKIIPNLDEIADFSDVENNYEHVEKCFQAAKRFIEYMLLNGKSDGYCFVLFYNE